MLYIYIERERDIHIYIYIVYQPREADHQAACYPEWYYDMENCPYSTKKVARRSSVGATL